MRYYYFNRKKREFEENNPPKYTTSCIQLKKDSLIEEVLIPLGIKVIEPISFIPNAHITNATINQCNRLFEEGKVEFAEPNILENIGSRLQDK